MSPRPTGLHRELDTPEAPELGSGLYQAHALSDAGSTPWDLGQLVQELRSARSSGEGARSEDLACKQRPSREALTQVVKGLRAVLFPTHFGTPDISESNIDFYVGHTLDGTLRTLEQQVRRTLAYSPELRSQQPDHTARELTPGKPPGAGSAHGNQAPAQRAGQHPQHAGSFGQQLVGLGLHVVDELEGGGGGLMRELEQQVAAMRGLGEAQPGDGLQRAGGDEVRVLRRQQLLQQPLSCVPAANNSAPAAVLLRNPRRPTCRCIRPPI